MFYYHFLQGDWCVGFDLHEIEAQQFLSELFFEQIKVRFDEFGRLYEIP